MDIRFKRIFEHDMDLLMMEEFISDPSFAELLLRKVGLESNCSILCAAHSLSDNTGESDITLLLQYPNCRVALLIEDKIDAPTMQAQSSRYRLRGEKGLQKGEYDDYRIILAAPCDYRKEHAADSNAAYEHFISYEEMRDYFAAHNTPRAEFKKSVIEFALQEKRRGYLVEEDASVTMYWQKLRAYCQQHFPQLILLGDDSPKGSGARWPEFKTALGNVRVVYKSPQGFVDLEFPHYGNRIGTLTKLLDGYLSPQMQLHKTGKSAVVRLCAPGWKVDFSRSFDESLPVLKDVFAAVSALCSLAAN